MKLFFIFFMGLFSLQAHCFSFNATTYNLGLAHDYVAYSKERLNYLGKELAKLDTDVLCLQEVWTNDDQDLLTNQLKANFPHVMRIDPAPRPASSKAICSLGDLVGENKFLSCLISKCSGKSGEAQTTCLIENCSGALDALKVSNVQCASALFSQVGKGTLRALWEVVSPFSIADTLAYGGSAGVMLFSKHPIEKVNVLDMAKDSTINRRALLHAELTTPESQKVGLFCTHLTADLTGEIPYPGKYQNWAEETLIQAKQIANYGASVAGPLVFMGDFNCSFSKDPSCEALLGISGGEKLTKSQDLISDCTFCRDNPLVKKGGNDLHIDHILFKGQGNLVQAKREMEQTFAVAPDRVAPLSDHFAISAQVTMP